LCRWLCRDAELARASFWDESTDWERAHSNEWELWCEESDRNRELIDQALAIGAADREAAFRLYLEAAEAGSVWAMELVAWYYHTGTAVAADFGQAQDYYYRAICAGSWMATIGYARLLALHGYFDYCEGVLEDGVRSDFVPAYFWLAWFRYEQSRTNKTCREIRPLLEHAAERGHPGAKLTIAQFMAKGRFGIRVIPKGFGQLLEIVPRFRSERNAGGTDGLQQTVTHVAAHEQVVIIENPY
jgi:TPR repeat protein